mmetsp:Transcript_21378/g.35368  ORF Transcript_21378/g.35368 Transcript_21378/m.35368 type:complete len:139 (-) Transcript_21378:1278-1694(-)
MSAPFPYWRFIKTPVYRRYLRSNQVWQQAEEAIIRERLDKADEDQHQTREDDFLSTVIESRESLGSTLEDMRHDIHDMIVAGHETTAKASAFALILLAQHQEFAVLCFVGLEVCAEGGGQHFAGPSANIRGREEATVL